MPNRGNVRLEKCYSGNSPSGRCPFGKLSFRGTARRGSVHQGIEFGELSVGGNVGRGTVRIPYKNVFSTYNSLLFPIIVLTHLSMTSRMQEKKDPEIWRTLEEE